MCFLKSIAVCCLFISVVTTAENKTREPDSIGFPEMEEDSNNFNKDNRQPVFIPATCPEGELYYPGDQKDDWICDCMPAFLYEPTSNRCWPAYRKGPCNDGYYLVLGEESAIPFCEKNPCNTNHYVMYKGKCERLGAITPCNNRWPDLEALTVNSTTLTVTCERIRLESRFQEQRSNVVQPVSCPTGSKRSINRKCSTTVTTP